MTKVDELVVHSPSNGEPIVRRKLATSEEAFAVLEQAHTAFECWRRTSLSERLKLMGRMVEVFVAKKQLLARELTVQMGRSSNTYYLLMLLLRLIYVNCTCVRCTFI